MRTSRHKSMEDLNEYSSQDNPTISEDNFRVDHRLESQSPKSILRRPRSTSPYSPYGGVSPACKFRVTPSNHYYIFCTKVKGLMTSNTTWSRLHFKLQENYLSFSIQNEKFSQGWYKMRCNLFLISQFKCYLLVMIWISDFPLLINENSSNLMSKICE